MFVEKCAAGAGFIYEWGAVGAKFIFGNLTDASGPWGFVFAINVLPVIIFFGALTSLLFHLGIIQIVVRVISFVVQPLLGTTGPETLCAIANSFLGQTEAPLVIKNYLKVMTKSELFVVMVSGMATISGAILLVFSAMGVPLNHLLTSSVMSIPASIVIAKILYPSIKKSRSEHLSSAAFERNTINIFDALFRGTTDGLSLAVNVAAMLVSFLALLAMINALLGCVGSLIALPSLSLNLIFSYIFAPFGYLLGFTGKQAFQVGQLLGTKIALNEVIAYGQMVSMDLPDRMVSIVTYTLCGFSNFSCIGIQIGGIGALVPERRAWLTELGLMAVLGGTLSNILSAMVVSLLI
jgi:CNT family concentrative nucleoside transporter